MKPFETVTSHLVRLPIDDVDTDQIIPARFLKITDKKGLGEKLFANWRYQEDGSSNPDFPLNQPAMQSRQILLAGANFGCGSSREHAPWALVAWGFRVVISTSFADIFRSNSLKNGLLLLQISETEHQELMAKTAADEALEVIVNLPAQELRTSEGMRVSFAIDAFAKRCLLEGMDQLAYLLRHEQAIALHEQTAED